MNKGTIHTEETKKRISESLKARVLPPRTKEHSKKISIAAKKRHAKRPQVSGKDHPRYSKVTFNCDNCGNEASKHKCNYDKGIHHFCSKKCSEDYLRGNNHPLKKDDMIKFRCSFCSKDSEQKRTVFDFGQDNHFCSKECFGNYMSESKSGENSQNWKGGTTDIYRLIRGSRSYRLWRTAIFIRDKYTCQECDKTKCEINSHHKITVRELIHKHNLKTIEDIESCDELWDITNGVTLCIDCHKEAHKIRKICQLS